MVGESEGQEKENPVYPIDGYGEYTKHLALKVALKDDRSIIGQAV